MANPAVQVSGDDAEARVSIPARFNGPPESSNGGYACGMAAVLLGAQAAQVTLRKPPPLDTPLTVVRDADSLELREGEETVVEAQALEGLDLDVPEPATPTAAGRASAEFPWYEGHPFPTCFVCGPQRPQHDGLEIFAGAVDGREDLYACAWTPAAELADESGAVRPEVVWAALDCPSAVAAAALADPDAGPAVLGRLTASLERQVVAGQPHVVAAWPLGRDGRKRGAGSAIFGPDGQPCARARATWIELRG